MKTTITLLLMAVFTLPAPASPLLGDFDGDNIWGCSDVDALVAEMVAGTNNPAFDLDWDGVVDSTDLSQWLVRAGVVNLPSGNPYVRGDADLDGDIDGIDYNIMYDNFTSGGVGYCGGDFNGDGFVDLSDIAILCGNAAPGFCSTVVAPEASSWGAAKATYR